MKIEIFGPGCAKCQKAEQEVEKVVNQLGIDATVEHVTDLDSMVNRGVMFTPAVFINDKKVIEGRVPTEAEVAKLIREAQK